MRILLSIALLLVLSACSKKTQDISNGNNPGTTVNNNKSDTTTAALPLTSVKYNGEIADPKDSFITYLIRKGNNYCDNNNYNITQYTSLRFTAILDSTCIYTTTDPTNQADINKLFGFADCSSHHQTNSARFGWNWHNGAMRIHAYCYAGSVRSYKELGVVTIGKAFDCMLTILPEKYVFELNGKTDTMLRGCNTTSAYGYKLLPYFGGNEAAPHDVKIKIKEM